MWGFMGSISGVGVCCADATRACPPSPSMRRSAAAGSPEDFFEVGDLRPRFAGGRSLEAEEASLRSLFPRREEDLTGAVSSGHDSEASGVFVGRHGGGAAFDLNENDLQFIAAFEAVARWAVVL